MENLILYTLIAVAGIATLMVEAQEGISTATYGADVSYPMHHKKVLSEEIGNPLGTNKQAQYEANMQGCIDYYDQAGHDGHEACWEVELERIAMNLRQPQSMVNYTRDGFVKIRAPPEVWQLVQEFWQANREELIDEEWNVGSIFVNHWKSPAHFVAVDNATLPGGGHILKNHIWNAARDTLSEWTGYQMADCSCYGVRVYQEGAVLAPHVDRLPLVSSAILNVDQDLDEPWPLEVIGHDGRSHNITMVPGDLILYESHSIIHGRPFPLKGRFMANIFMHFEPVAPLSEPNPVFRGDLPPYIIPGSPEESNWRKNNPDGWYAVQTKRMTGGTTEAHLAAVRGEIEVLTSVLDIHPKYANAADALGWTPLHEAVRHGNTLAAQFLIERGADKDAITESGESVLGLAYNFVQTRDPDYSSDPDKHPLIQFLNGLGAENTISSTQEEL